MVKNKLITAIAALGLMAASVAAQAAVPSATFIASDTPTTLSVSWTGDLNSFASLTGGINASLNYWDILNVSSQSILVNDMTFWTVTVEAQHHSVIPAHPHGVDSEYGVVFKAGLGGTYGTTASTQEWNNHNAALETVPGYSLMPHSDNYTLSVVSAAAEGGVSKMTLTAIHPVPEPETYAMFLAGLGLLGAVARRRKMDA